MSIMSSLFLFLCLSMHACEARSIRIGHKGFHAPFLHSGKGLFVVVQKLRLGMEYSSRGLVKKEDVRAEKGHGGAISSTQGTKDSKTVTSLKGLEHASRAQKPGPENAGSTEPFESSGNMGLLKATSTTTNKEARRRDLSAKEAVDSSDHNRHDNVVFTDYSPPHQTPPIHNRKT